AGQWRTLRTEFTCNALYQAPPTSDGAFLFDPVCRSAITTEDNVPNSPADAPPLAAGLIIRAREPGDWQDIAALTELPKVRWGTLRLPFTSKEQWRKAMETPSDGMVGIVAVLQGQLVGSAGIQQYKGRRRHAGDIGMSVHDDFQGRGIGTALMAALI